jgi:hypothetical protein
VTCDQTTAPPAPEGFAGYSDDALTNDLCRLGVVLAGLQCEKDKYVTRAEAIRQEIARRDAARDADRKAREGAEDATPRIKPHLSAGVIYVRRDGTYGAAIVTKIYADGRVDLVNYLGSSLYSAEKISYSKAGKLATWHWPEVAA